MTLRVEKLSGFSFVRRNRKYWISALRMLSSFWALRLSEMEGSFMIDSSSSALALCQ